MILDEPRVGPITPDEVGLDSGHEPVGVRFTGEAPRPLPTQRIAVTDPPRFAAIGPFLDMGHALDPSSGDWPSEAASKDVMAPCHPDVISLPFPLFRLVRAIFR